MYTSLFMDNKKVCVWLEPDLYEYLDEARGEELKIPQFIRLILKQKMKRAVKKRKPKGTVSSNADPFTYSVIKSDMIPDDLKEYADLIIEWWAIRHKNKATCSTSVSERIFKKLRSFAPEAKKLALEKAITGGWKDIYEIKESFKQEQVTSHPPVAQFNDDGMIQ